MELMTREQFEKLTKEEQMGEVIKANNEAKNDDTPYISINDDEIHVLGDPNKTEIKPHDYEVTFAFPKTEWKDTLERSGEKIEEETEGYYKVTRKFENVYLLPRRATHVTEAFARVQGFLNKVTVTDDKGNLEIRPLTEKEMLDYMRELNEDVENAMYTAVGAFLNLTQAETDCMLLSSVVYNTVKIFVDTPELVNGSDLLFG